MKELGDILAAVQKLKEPAVVATVVAVEGSTYRRPGARMLVSPEAPGGRIGSISGGCLEDEACRRAMYLTKEGPAVVTYQTGLDDGAGAGTAAYTLGCGGRVTVLYERVGPGVTPAYLALVRDCRAAGRSVVVATVVGVEGDIELAVGDRPAIGAEGGACAGPCTGPFGELAAAADASLDAGASRHVTIDGPAGRARIFVEFIPAPLHLVLFGSGHDVVPVAGLALGLGWRVTVGARRMPDALRRMTGVACIAPDQAASCVGAGSRRSAAIVMNHNYAADTESIAQLLHSPIAYIGILGPRHRTDAMLSDVAASRRFDAALARVDLSRVHAPIGLDIGAEAPEEVALAIVAEVHAFFARRDGGRLRDRRGAIHPPVEGNVSAPVINAACAVDAAP